MRIVIYFLGIAVLLLVISCEERGIEIFENKISFVQFLHDATKDTTYITFKSYPDGVAEIPVITKRFGKWADEIENYRIEVDKKLTTLPAGGYELPGVCGFRNGQELDTLWVKLFNFEELKDSVYQLVLKVAENETIKEGVVVNRRNIVRVTDKLIKPKWWTVLNGGYNGQYTFNIAEVYYLGKYSEKKYLMFIEELNKDGVTFDGENLSVLRLYALRLKYRIEEHNRLYPNDQIYDEENGEYMTIPVAG